VLLCESFIAISLVIIYLIVSSLFSNDNTNYSFLFKCLGASILTSFICAMLAEETRDYIIMVWRKINNILNNDPQQSISNIPVNNNQVVEIFPKTLRELYKRKYPIKSIICPHCLKSILVNELDAICPFCDSVYSKTENVLSVLLDKCPKCDGKIKLYQCVFCRQHIDLFAPYNESELEKRRYE